MRSADAAGAGPGGDLRTSPGVLLGGRYRLEQPLATGGMGTVWRARDELLDRPVAVKLLRPELAADPDFLARFRAEARHAAAVRHPGVATVHDYGEDPTPDLPRRAPGNGHGHGPQDTVDLRAADPPAAGKTPGAAPRAWLVMDLVEAEPLSALLARERRLGTERTLAVVAGTADALAAAHAVGVVHRDVKPANLLISPDGRVVVTDFGIARAAGAASLTRTGTLLGTAAYLSPEQAAGRPATAASDLYSLGVVAYECLAGHKPFDGESDVAVALAHGRDPVPPLPDDVPAPVRALVLRLLDKDPQDRPADAGEVAAHARRLAAGPADATDDADDADDAGDRPAPTRALEPGATTVLPPVDLPATGRSVDGRPVDGPAVDPQPTGRRRRPGLLALGVVAAALLVAGVAALAHPGRTPSPTPSASSPSSPSSKPSSAPASPARTTVLVDPAAYLGRPVDQVRGALTGLGLPVRLVAAAGPGPVGTVAGLTPTGAVARGTTITLRVVERTGPTAPARKDEGHGGKGDGHKGPGHGDGKGKG